MTTAIIATDVTVGYSEPILGPLSFHLQLGERVGLCGPNGSGKSTLLKAIAHNATVFSGEIQRPSDISIGYQVQHPVKLEEMPVTVQEYLRAAGADAPPLPAKLEPLRATRLDRLSGGQFQLLSVLGVLNTSAPLVLLDEPTNNLDPESDALLRELLTQPSPNRAILIVSHDISFLNHCCDRLIEVSA